MTNERQENQTYYNLNHPCMNAETNLSFIADANALKLRAPVATIAQRTGEKKTNVSAYLRGKKMAGFVFVIKFYEAFADDLEKIGQKRVVSVYIAPQSSEP